jgi:hypothetical protein
MLLAISMLAEKSVGLIAAGKWKSALPLGDSKWPIFAAAHPSSRRERSRPLVQLCQSWGELDIAQAAMNISASMACAGSGLFKFADLLSGAWIPAFRCKKGGALG